jgi:phage tail sheath gpL-like
MISTAIDSSRVSRVVGYKVKKANFSPNTPNLPQRYAIFGEANTAEQAGLTTEPFEFISAKEVGDKYGYGSPLYQMARILRPVQSNILGGIPTVIYPQIEEGGATATIIKIGVVVATTVTENATHKIIINGRDNIDGVSYSFNVVKGQDAAAVKQSIIDAISNVLACPGTAAINVDDIDFTTKWAGLSSAEVNLSFDVGAKPAGIVYSEISKTDGTGTVDVATSLALFDEKWNTVVINPYADTKWEDFETYNGVPDPLVPTGRYLPTVFKPFVALSGNVSSDKAILSALTDASARKDQVTNVLCPAPNSKGCSWEAAANMGASWALIAQDSPHLDNSNRAYPDMPVPSDENVGDFADYDNRDFLVKKGCSTVVLKSGKYYIQDFVTTYHPDGETPPKFRFVRDLNIDWNMGFGWILIMERDIQDKAIVESGQAVSVSNTVSPKQAKQLAISFINDKALLALISDTVFSEESIEVGVNGSNPARLDIFFRYKRTSTAHIVSSDVEVDFAFPI